MTRNSAVHTIIIPGPPVPLARPRLGKYGVYDSQKQLKKQFIAELMLQKNSWTFLTGPIEMHIEFHMKSTAMKEVKCDQLYHVKRPDLSNMIKFVEDCLQPHVYEDDCQIWKITASKINSLIPETRVYIWSTSMEYEQNDDI